MSVYDDDLSFYVNKNVVNGRFIKENNYFCLNCGLNFILKGIEQKYSKRINI